MADYTQEGADIRFEMELDTGVDRETATKNVFNATGFTPNAYAPKGKDVAAAPPEPQSMSDDQADDLYNATESLDWDQKLTNDWGGPASDNINDARLDKVFDAAYAAGEIDFATISAATLNRTINRATNLAELTGGSAVESLGKAQQIVFGFLMGEGKKAFSRGNLSTVAELPHAVTSKDVETIRDIRMIQWAANNPLFDEAERELMAKFADDPTWMDMEPQIIERQENSIYAEDVLAKWAGGEDKFGQFLAENQSWAPSLMATAATAMDIAGDPLFLAELAPRLFISAGKAIGVLTKGKHVPWQKSAGPFADLLKARGKQVSKISKIREQLKVTKDPEAQRSLMIDLEKSQKAYVSLEATVRQQTPSYQPSKTFKEGDEYADMVKAYIEEPVNSGTDDIRGPIRRNPETVTNMADGTHPLADEVTDPKFEDVSTYQKSASEVARAVEARKYASVEDVNLAVKEQGYRSLYKFKEALVKGNKQLRDGVEELSEETVEAFNSFERLPDNIKKHLHASGWSRERIIRQHALRAPQLEMKQGLWDPRFDSNAKPGAVEAWLEKRAMLGPTDAEEIGDAAMRFSLGAGADDLNIHGSQIPEWKDFETQGHYADWGDGDWAPSLEIKRPDLVALEDGTQVIPDVNQTSFNFNRTQGGLTPGSFHLRVGEITTKTADFFNQLPGNKQVRAAGYAARRAGGKAKDSVMGSKNAGDGWRQPQNVLEGTGAYDQARAAAGKYHTQVLVHEHWFESRLKKYGLGKRNKNGRLIASNKAAKKSLQTVFRLLDSDGDDLVKTLTTATDQEKALYGDMRRWLDDASSYLDLPDMGPGQKLSGYAPHVFPLTDIMNGARPMEFVGLPTTAEVGFNHLRFRKGKTGYSEELIDVFQGYNRGMHRKKIMEPAYDGLLTMRDKLQKAGDGMRAQYVDDLVRDMKGYPSALGNLVKKDLAAVMPQVNFNAMSRSSQAALTLSSLMYHGLLAGNPTYLMQNVATAAVNNASKFGMLATMRGHLAWLDPGAKGKALRKLVEDSGASGQMRQFHDQIGHNVFDKYFETMQGNKFVKALSGVEQSELMVRGIAMHASLGEQLKAAGMTWQQAIDQGVANKLIAQGVREAEFTQHVYGRFGRSPKFKKYIGEQGVQAGLQFLSFPLKQIEMLGTMFRQNPGYAIRYLAYSGLVARHASEAGIDLRGSVGLQATQLSSDPNEPIRTSPVVGAVVNAVTLGAMMGNEVQSLMTTGNSQWDPEEGERLMKEMGRDIENMGGYLKRTQRYMKRMAEFYEGAEYDKDGRLTRYVGAEPTEGLAPIKGFTKEKLMSDDFVPRLLGLKGMADSRERDRADERWESMRNTTFQMNKLENEVLDAYYDGDKEKVNELVKRAWRQHGRKIDVSDMVKTAEESAMIERETRDMIASPKTFPKQRVHKPGQRGEIR